MLEMEKLFPIKIGEQCCGRDSESWANDAGVFVHVFVYQQKSETTYSVRYS